MMSTIPYAFCKPKFYPACLLLIFLFSCASTHSLKSPKKNGDLPELPASEIDIPVRIAGAPILSKEEDVIPTIFTSDAWPNFIQPSCDFKYKYRFERGKLKLTCANNSIGISFSGAYQVAGASNLCTAGIPVTPWVSGSCGFVPEPMRKVNIALRTVLQFGSSYQVKTKTTITRLQATDHCEVSVFSNDITQLVVDSIRSSLLSFTSAMDQTIAGLSFDKYVQHAKDSVYRKVAIGQYGYVLVNPSAIRIGELNYINDSFSISVGMTFHPDFSSDSVLRSHVPDKFPRLQQKETAPGILLYLDAVYDYAFLSKLLHDSLHNKIFEVKKRTIVVKDASLRGMDNNQVELRVDFAGSNHGSIFVRGTPELDTAKQTLMLQNVAYSMEGEDLALKLARSLFRNKIRKTIEGKSYLDIGALIKTNAVKIDHQLNRELAKGIYSSGKATKIKMIGLLATKDYLHAQVMIKGELAILSDGIF